MQVVCPLCKHEESEPAGLAWAQYVCVNCAAVATKDALGELTWKSGIWSSKLSYPTFQVNEPCFIRGKHRIVSAIVLRKTVDAYVWMEYYLHAEGLQDLYLSEYQGHWTLSEELEDDKELSKHQGENLVFYKGLVFDCYAHEAFSNVGAAGFFVEPVSTMEHKNTEWINPPEALCREMINKSDQTWYLDTHVPMSELKAAFGDRDYLSPQGPSALKLFPFDTRAFSQILGGFALITLFFFLISWWAFPASVLLRQGLSPRLIPNTDPSEQSFSNSEWPIDTHQYNLRANSDFVSQPFVMNQWMSNIRCDLSANVDNSWTNIDMVLINDETGEERHLEADIEYYHGVEGGESWSEGDKTPRFFICGVPKGIYHFELSCESIRPHEVYLKASRDSAPSRNLLAAMLLFALVVGGAHYWEHVYEVNRWSDSDYTPYAEDEDD